MGYGKIESGQTFATISLIEICKSEKDMIKKLNENDAFGYDITKKKEKCQEYQKKY